MATAQLGTLMRHIRGLASGRADRPRTDRQLLEDFAARRDESAFADLVGRHGPMVLRVCRRVLGHEQDAEDAFQATFLVLARNTAAIRKRGSLASWLYGVAYRTALKAKRGAARRRKQEARHQARRTDLLSVPPTWDDVQEVLHEEVRRLPDSLRAGFVLCVLEGKTEAAAAAELGVKEGTLSWRLTRARQRLRQRLARRGVELSAVLAALAVAQEAGRAALPAALLDPTIRFGLSAAAGGLAAGVIPSHIAALAAGVTRAMFLSKTKIAAILLIAAGLLAAGAGMLRHRTLAAPAAPDSPAPPTAQAPARPPAEDKESLSCAGRVLDPDGKPVGGANLFVTCPTSGEPASGKDFVLEQVGTTDAKGRFHLRLARPDRQKPFLLAHAAGFGVDWCDLEEGKGTKELMLRLVKDVSIRGRVVNPEGRPIAGVSVSVRSIAVPTNEKLDDFLAGWLRDPQDQLSMPKKALNGVALDGVGGAATTDRDGRFTLHGAGGERIVFVTVAGGVARSSLLVLTRPGFDPGPYNAVLRKDPLKKEQRRSPLPSLQPPGLTVVAVPGKTIEGTVKDAASGKPLAGCRLSALVPRGDGVRTVSDAEGNYRLEGLAKNSRGYTIHASAPGGGTHLNRVVHAADTDGFTTVRLDVELVKGAVVTGRVVDKQTGKGVQCGIRFAPLPGNPFFASKPGFDTYRTDHTMQGTDKDGRFRLVTIPGKGLVLAQAHEGEKFHGKHLSPYRRAVPDPDHKDLFKPEDDSWVVQTAGGIEFLSVENAVKVIDVQESGETKMDLFVERGTTARIEVRDVDGKQLAGTWAAGLADHWPITYQLPEATATVYALDPAKPRTMAFLHVEKKLGGKAVVRGDEKEPVVVKLAPLGQVSGRLRDGDGHPLSGVEVSIQPGSEIGRELYRFATPARTPVRTDKDGRFRLDNIVPGLQFWLLRREADSFVPERAVGVQLIKPGEALDLGDVQVKPAR